MTAARVPGTKHSWEVTCRRCQGTRWVIEATADVGQPYTCTRCRAALAGKNVIDPLLPAPTQAQEAARQAARARFEAIKRRRSGAGQGVDSGPPGETP